jgi:VWFA-related protein
LIVAIQASANASANLTKLGDTGNLLTQLVAGDRGQTSLVSFADDLRVLSDFTASSDRLSLHLRNLHVRGQGSAALDTIMEAMTMLTRRASAHRRVLLVIGETRDRSSKLALDMVAQEAQRQNVLIYWMAYSPFLSELTAGTANQQAPSRGNLLNVFGEARQRAKADAASELTRVTGGRVVHYLTKHSLEDALQAIGAEIHRQYLVSFHPPGGSAGEYHAIRIEVKGRPELAVRSRAGYWSVQ